MVLSARGHLGAGMKLWLSDAGPHTSPLPWWLCLQETPVRPLGREDPLEKGMATRSSILAWIMPWTEEPGGLQSQGVAKSWVRLSN